MLRNTFVSCGLLALAAPSLHANLIFRARVPELLQFSPDLVVETIDGSNVRGFATPGLFLALDDWTQQELLGLSSGIVGVDKITGVERTLVTFGDLGVSSLAALTHYQEGVVASFDELVGPQSLLLIDLDAQDFVDGFFPLSIVNNTGSSLRGLDTDISGRLIASGAGFFEIDLDTGALSELTYSQSLLAALGFGVINDFDISMVDGREVITGHAGDFGELLFQADYQTGDLLWTRAAAADLSRGLAVGFCDADFNRDGVVDAFDLIDFVHAVDAGDHATDINDDTFIDGLDVDAFILLLESIDCQSE